MPKSVTSRPDITPGSTLSWVDIDVTSHLGGDAGSVAGVIIEIINNGSPGKEWGVRKNGSTDAIKKDLGASGHCWVAIGIDSDDILEGYKEHANIEFRLVGYILNTEGSFFTNVVDVTLSATNTWEDIDISSDTGGDTATCAFLQVHNTQGFTRSYGFRENGSTDNRYQSIDFSDLFGAMMSVDGSEILEGKVASTTAIKFYLTGYLTDNFTSFTNAKDYSTATTASWVNADFSSDISSGNIFAFLHFYGTLPRLGGFRNDGETYDNYLEIDKHIFFFSEISSSQVGEQKISGTELDLFLWGYGSEPAAAGATFIPKIMFY